MSRIPMFNRKKVFIYTDFRFDSEIKKCAVISQRKNLLDSRAKVLVGDGVEGINMELINIRIPD